MIMLLRFVSFVLGVFFVFVAICTSKSMGIDVMSGGKLVTEEYKKGMFFLFVVLSIVFVGLFSVTI